MADTTVWLSLLNNLPGIITSIGTFLGILYAARKLKAGQDSAAKVAVDSKVQSDQKLDAIHGLVNSALGTSLRSAALAWRRVAMLTKDPEDIGVAAAATKAADEHDERQAKLDAKKD